VLGSLNKAMKTYDSLAGYDAEDLMLDDAVIDTHEEVSKLPQIYSDLWSVFKEVKNKHDNESMERHLAAEDKREEFYEALTAYQKGLMVALATEHFYADVAKDRIKGYKDDLKNFRSLRSSVQQRYAETIDFAQYEKQIRKVMDTHIQAPDVGIVTELLNIFDTEAFDAEVEKKEGKAAKADTIASRVKKTVIENMEEDPVFYKKFADLVEQAINDYRQGRIDESEYLQRVTDYMETIRRGHDVDIPIKLEGHGEAQAYFGILNEVLDPAEEPELKVAEESAQYGEISEPIDLNEIAGMSLDLEGIIAKRKIRDWMHNEDVINKIQIDIDDYLYSIKNSGKVDLTTSDMDIIMERCISVAKRLAGN